DLNLLVALRALLAEQHVTHAAARVGLTQPAMSHALARLRNVLGDPLLGGRALEELDEDRIDVVLGPADVFGRAAGSFRVQKLMSERFVCVVREDHASVGKRLSLDRFLAQPHALITPSGNTGGIVDAALAKLGKQRRIAVEVPHFLVAPFLVEKTDVILTLAERVARALAPAVRLQRLAPPPELELPGFDISLVWQERHQTDPAHAWFRSVVSAVAKKL
ncbi:MAG TPA: LysR family transcriptional regulator, partial [Labilithrix sp.]|nr:LysR family transcriptional regulator [Labilithrix sp.]